MNEETTLIAFKAITTFVKDLHDFFGNKNKSLKLYNRLIQHTKIFHEQAIAKHISLFQNFCKENLTCIQNKTLPLLMGTIVYSDNVYIDMSYIFSRADDETKEAIWKHLLTIDAIINHSSHSKELLLQNSHRSFPQNTETKDNTDNFLKNMLEKVQNSNVENPMELLSSGVMTEMMGGVQQQMASGNLDITKLMGSVKTMMNSLAQEAGDDPQITQLMGMVNGLMTMAPAMMQNSNTIPSPSSLPELNGGNPSSAPTGMDMTMVTQLFGSMMSGMQVTQNKNPSPQ